MKIILAFLIMLTMSAMALAQDYTPGFKAKEGNNAILFNLTGLADLSADNYGGGLGYLYYFANHMAFRFGMGLNYNSETTAKPEGMDHDQIISSLSMTMTPGLRYNVGISRNVLAYSGFEAMVSLGKETVTGENFVDITKTNRNTAVGGGVFLGAEWFAWDNVSLSAEYKLMYVYSFGSSTVESSGQTQESDTPVHQSVDLSASSANFTISFYFY